MKRIFALTIFVTFVFLVNTSFAADGWVRPPYSEGVEIHNVYCNTEGFGVVLVYIDGANGIKDCYYKNTGNFDDKEKAVLATLLAAKANGWKVNVYLLDNQDQSGVSRFQHVMTVK